MAVEVFNYHILFQKKSNVIWLITDADVFDIFFFKSSKNLLNVFIRLGSLLGYIHSILTIDAFTKHG